MRYLALLFSLALLLAVPADAVNLPSTTADYAGSGTLSAPGTVAVQVNGTSTVLVGMTGNGTGLTFSFQCYDGSGWIAINAYPISSGALGAPVTTGSANGDWVINSAGCSQTGNTGVRVNLTAIATGSQTIKLNASSGVGPNSVNLIPGGAVSGTGSAGTAAVGVMTVQGIAGMTKLLVTPDSVALPANQSVNVAQINGVAPLMGNGVTGTGSHRVTPASDSSAIANWGHAAVGAGTAPANMVVGGAIYNSTEISPTTGQSFAVQADAKGRARQVIMDAAGNTRGANVNASNQLSVSVDNTPGVNQTQVGGVAVATGNGVVGTGVAREAIASDNSAIANWGHGATGSAAPAGSTYISALSNGATGGQLTGAVICKQHAFVHITTATDTLLVQGVASQTIRICAWTSAAAGTATWYFENTASTNANCASTLTQIAGIRTEAINTGEVVSLPFGTYLSNTSGNGVCVKSTGTGGVDIDVWYAQF